MRLPPSLPEAGEIVHPALPGSAYPFHGLCGAGVAFKLAWALCQRASQSKKVGEPMKNFLLQAVGLVALGTVADVVPLVDENRVFVRHGLASIKTRPSVGLAALLKVTQLDQKAVAHQRGYGLHDRPAAERRRPAGPGDAGRRAADHRRRPSAGRPWPNICTSSTAAAKAWNAASIWPPTSRPRQFDVDGDPALVLAGRGWHPGVIGIVAGRLAEKFHRPVVLIAFDELGVKPGVGSARSIPGFDLHAGLATCSEHLVSHGGHAAAAGLKIAEDRVEAFGPVLRARQHRDCAGRARCRTADRRRGAV